MLIVIVLVVAGAIGLVAYLSGMSIGAKQGGLDREPPEPVERRISASEAERQLTPETRRARRRRRRQAT